MFLHIFNKMHKQKRSILFIHTSITNTHRPFIPPKWTATIHTPQMDRKMSA